MPQASARRRREDDEAVDGPDRVQLRLVDDPEASERPAKPHPRSRLRPPASGEAIRPLREPQPRPTVHITGQPTPSRRRSPAAARTAARPDRVAMWAVGLGLFMAFMAAATARAEPPAATPASTAAEAVTLGP